MPADRLLAPINAARWRRVRSVDRPRLCREELVQVEKYTRVDLTMAVADAVRVGSSSPHAVRVADSGGGD